MPFKCRRVPNPINSSRPQLPINIVLLNLLSPQFPINSVLLNSRSTLSSSISYPLNSRSTLSSSIPDQSASIPDQLSPPQFLNFRSTLSSSIVLLGAPVLVVEDVDVDVTSHQTLNTIVDRVFELQEFYAQWAKVVGVPPNEDGGGRSPTISPIACSSSPDISPNSRTSTLPIACSSSPDTSPNSRTSTLAELPTFPPRTRGRGISPNSPDISPNSRSKLPTFSPRSPTSTLAELPTRTFLREVEKIFDNSSLAEEDGEFPRPWSSFLKGPGIGPPGGRGTRTTTGRVDPAARSQEHRGGGGSWLVQDPGGSLDAEESCAHHEDVGETGAPQSCITCGRRLWDEQDCRNLQCDLYQNPKNCRSWDFSDCSTRSSSRKSSSGHLAEQPLSTSSSMELMSTAQGAAVTRSGSPSQVIDKTKFDHLFPPLLWLNFTQGVTVAVRSRACQHDIVYVYGGGW